MVRFKNLSAVFFVQRIGCQVNNLTTTLGLIFVTLVIDIIKNHTCVYCYSKAQRVIRRCTLCWNRLAIYSWIQLARTDSQDPLVGPLRLMRSALHKFIARQVGLERVPY